jgi:RimJ/RimL family protein N-acetyltransferase
VKILETKRLIVRELDAIDDAEFILDLLNQPSFIRFIGDRGVRTVAESRDFIENRYRQSYRDNGFGLYAVDLKGEPATQIGICGFVRRPGLDEPDIGFAFLPQYEGFGYAFESAEAVLEHGREVLDIQQVMAITTVDNEGSVRLLTKLGFEFSELVVLPGSDDQLNLFVKK